MSGVELSDISTSLNKVFCIVVGVVSILFCMPLVALASITNLQTITTPDGSTSLYNEPRDLRDTYDFGNCTYWAALQRLQAGRPIPNTWGNANTWAERAQRDGYRVDHFPAIGAIMQTTTGRYGHVAVVVRVDPTTLNWTISEMNFFGFDQTDERTLPAAQAVLYSFIHERSP